MTKRALRLRTRVVIIEEEWLPSPSSPTSVVASSASSISVVPLSIVFDVDVSNSLVTWNAVITPPSRMNTNSDLMFGTTIRLGLVDANVVAEADVFNDFGSNIGVCAAFLRLRPRFDGVVGVADGGEDVPSV
ncbi:hypothetical protein DERF_005162 [Dermatophagoides farinae]|uniref:Uncharacterized protein n=1 Tax=Dermatophagoides farinae TaxID=6954 RepID=A0A922KY32_DERFA|nr:hypothetical protein DERF_015760 [Dermatophagoides farinae]KAH9521511.1 hypothetical protein DERF_005162 [Dermatophagoides farinae]